MNKDIYFYYHNTVIKIRKFSIDKWLWFVTDFIHILLIIDHLHCYSNQDNFENERGTIHNYARTTGINWDCDKPIWVVILGLNSQKTPPKSTAASRTEGKTAERDWRCPLRARTQDGGASQWSAREFSAKMQDSGPCLARVGRIHKCIHCDGVAFRCLLRQSTEQPRGRLTQYQLRKLLCPSFEKRLIKI